MKENKVKAVALLSGGLDSTLAVKMMIDQGVEVHALNFTSAFCNCNAGAKNKGEEGVGCKSQALRVANEFNIPVKVMLKGLDYIEVVRKPKHGYGKGINPCVDCRIFMFKRAKKYMDEIGASFIITGEVLGQRPMSQRMDAMNTIDKECGLEGLILRPLSAKFLEATIAEKEGLVDREKLLAVSGRSRRPQIELADDLSVENYPCPSGGCLLTDKIFSKKVRDLLEHKEDVTLTDLQKLKLGRHLRFNGVKIIVGRNDTENKKLKEIAEEGDTLIEPDSFAGPSALICGENIEGMNEFAASVIMRYAKNKSGAEETLKSSHGGKTELFNSTPIADDSLIDKVRVC